MFILVSQPHSVVVRETEVITDNQNCILISGNMLTGLNWSPVNDINSMEH